MKEVKRYAKEHCKYPLLEEYDFRNDHKNPLLSMDLRPSTTIRVSRYVWQCNAMHMCFTFDSFT
jgi:hypothetical protein